MWSIRPRKLWYEISYLPQIKRVEYNIARPNPPIDRMTIYTYIFGSHINAVPAADTITISARYMGLRPYLKQVNQRQ